MNGPEVSAMAPSLGELTRWLREVNDTFAVPECGPEFVQLTLDGASWEVTTYPHDWPHFGREWVPGKAGWDAVAAARRLLSDARSGGAR